MKVALVFGTWNVKSPCRSASLKTIARKLEKCNLDLVEIQEVEWDSGTVENEFKSFGHTLIESHH